MGDAMTEYERKRLANIQRNIEFMKTMGVSSVRECQQQQVLNAFELTLASLTQ
jgi:hypothetical protein